MQQCECKPCGKGPGESVKISPEWGSEDLNVFCFDLIWFLMHDALFICALNCVYIFNTLVVIQIAWLFLASDQFLKCPVHRADCFHKYLLSSWWADLRWGPRTVASIQNRMSTILQDQILKISQASSNSVIALFKRLSSSWILSLNKQLLWQRIAWR